MMFNGAASLVVVVRYVSWMIGIDKEIETKNFNSSLAVVISSGANAVVSTDVAIFGIVMAGVASTNAGGGRVGVACTDAGGRGIRNSRTEVAFAGVEVAGIGSEGDSGSTGNI